MGDIQEKSKEVADGHRGSAAHDNLVHEAWSKSAIASHPDASANKTVSSKRYLSETVTTREVNFFKHAGLYPDDILARQDEKLAVKGEQGAKDKKQQEEIIAVKHLINTQGVSPSDSIKQAARDSRVVAMGEPHVDQASPQRLWAASIMKDLRQQGITHLAVEFPSSAQKIFDKFNRGARGTNLDVPMQLSSHDSDDTAMMLKGLDRLSQQRPDLMTLWKAARDNGIKLVAVDNMSVYMDDTVPGFKKLYARRDSDMKDTVMKVLDENSDNKVLAWLGGLHMANLHGAKSGKAFAEQINDAFNKRGRGEKITTIFGATNEHTEPDLSTQPFADALKRPIAVPTHLDGSADVLGRLPVLRDDVQERSQAVRLENYDSVMLFPGKK